MAVIGMWLAVVGYGLAYAGMQKLAGRQCGIVEAFQGRCSAAAQTSAATQGTTNQARLLAQQSQQAALIGTQPISQVA